MTNDLSVALTFAHFSNIIVKRLTNELDKHFITICCLFIREVGLKADNKFCPYLIS